MNTRRMIKSGTDVERVLACVTLMQGGISNRWAVPMVSKLLAHPSPCVRAVALESLSEIEGDERFAARAEAMLATETDRTVRELATGVVERWPELTRKPAK